jgi:hypothetical protein
MKAMSGISNEFSNLSTTHAFSTLESKTLSIMPKEKTSYCEINRGRS